MYIIIFHNYLTHKNDLHAVYLRCAIYVHVKYLIAIIIHKYIKFWFIDTGNMKCI